MAMTPLPPDLLVTTTTCVIKLFLSRISFSLRAAVSSAAPGPEGTVYSIIRVGTHACAWLQRGIAANAAATKTPETYFPSFITVSLQLAWHAPDTEIPFMPKPCAGATAIQAGLDRHARQPRRMPINAEHRGGAPPGLPTHPRPSHTESPAFRADR